MWPYRQPSTKLHLVGTTGELTIKDTQEGFCFNEILTLLLCCYSIKVHELSESKYISSVVQLDEDIKGKCFLFFILRDFRFTPSFPP